MGRDVLDLIDNVVAEHELLSADAMRWAPDAPDPTPDGPLPAEVWDRCIVDETHEWIADQLERRIADMLGAQVTPWQYELVGRIFEVPVQMLLSRPEVERRVRLRRMHPDYRRRNRGR